MVDELKMEAAANMAVRLASDERYGNRIKHWQTKAAEADPDNTLNLHGGRLGALALVVGLNTPDETTDLAFDQVIKILHADRHTSFDDVLEDLRKRSTS